MSCLLSAVLVPYGKLDAASLRRAYEADPKQRLQLQLRKQARPGQKEALEHIPCYAHVRVCSALQWSAVLCCARVMSLIACTSDLAYSQRLPRRSLATNSHFVQETIDNTGKRDALEIVYMKFFAYNGCAGTCLLSCCRLCA